MAWLIAGSTGCCLRFFILKTKWFGRLRLPNSQPLLKFKAEIFPNYFDLGILLNIGAMKEIHFDNEHRKKHFDFFRRMNHPHFSVTANVNITRLLRKAKAKGKPFMPTVVWVVSDAANGIPQFRQRIRGEKVVEHEAVHPSFAIDTEVSDVFSFCEVKYQKDYRAFLQDAIATIEKTRKYPVFEDEHGRDDYLFLSSLPWVSFTAVTHAMAYHPHDCVPRITWGKYFHQSNEVMMPLSVQAHHALVDGRHVGLFFENIQRLCEEVSRWL